MGFFKEIKEDASQAIKELMPEEEILQRDTEEDLVVNTLEDELDVETELSKLDGLLESVPDEPEKPEETVEETAEEPAEVETAAEEVAQPEETEEVQEEIKEETELQEEQIKEEPFMSMETETSVNMQEENKVQEETTSTVETAPAASEEIVFDTPAVATDEVTVITEGTSLTGNIQSNGSIDLRGIVTGDVQCNGKLTVTGTVHGNTASAEFFADNAKLEGEVTSTGTVKIGLGSVIVGNISASSAVIAGAIKGDIDVQGPVVVDTSAVVMGNIKSRSVQINNGAVIEGFCSQCYAEIDVESLFAKK